MGSFCAYVILHNFTGGVYIGSTGDFYQRRHQHLSNLKYNKHPNRHLQQAYNFDPTISFTEYMATSREEAYSIEQRLVNEAISVGKTVFNVGVVNVVAPGQGVIPSEETRRKIGLANTGRNLGGTLSEEHKQKISESRIGMTFSDEHRMRLSEAHKGQKPSNVKPVVIQGVTYDSYSSAAEALGMKMATVRQRCLSQSPQFTDWTLQSKEY